MSEKAKKGRVSLLDLLVFILIAAGIAGLVIRYDIAASLFHRSEPVNVTVSFVAEGLRPGALSAFSKGNVFLLEGGRTFGELLSGSAGASVTVRENSEGLPVFSDSTEESDFRGTFSCSAVPSDRGWLLDGSLYIAPGSVLTVYCGGVAADILLLSLTETAEK